jgi:rhodanese-related sulfurtransferase
MTFRWNIGFTAAAASLMLASCAAPRKDIAQPEFRKTDSPKPVSAKPRAEVSTISLEDFFQLQESGKAVIIDARPSFVYHFGHVPGAINLPKNHCDEMIPAREAEFRSAAAAGKKIVVYCTGPQCPDARTVSDHLAGSGISASVFPGGWEAWREAGMPVE